MNGGAYLGDAGQAVRVLPPSPVFLAAIALTLLAAVFIMANDEPLGRIFWHLITIHDLPAAWLMLAMLVGGYYMALHSKGDGAWVRGLLLAVDRQRNLLMVLLWGLLCAGSIFVYRNHPLSMDEYAVVFQARIFAAGALHSQFPVELLDNLIPREFQNFFLMVNRQNGAVFSAYSPGFSLLLTPFVWLDMPWACNPTIQVASVLTMARIARELIPSPYAAGWTILFALGSPAFVANGITYYPMPAHLLLNLCFVWLLLSISPQRLFFAGLVGGFALSLHNPFPHAVFALPWIGWLVTRRKEWHRNLFWIGIGYLLSAVPLVVGWALWQREMMQSPVLPSVFNGAAPMAQDFFARALAVIQSFFRVLKWPDELIAYARLGGLVKLWLWASPLLLLFAWWGGRESKSVTIRLLGASALVTFFSYFLVRFDQGHGWGYRYFHSAWGVLPILAAAGTIKAASFDEGTRWIRTLAVLTLASLVASNGLRLLQIQEFMEGHLAQFPPRTQAKFRIVVHNDRGYYGHDLIQNDPWLNGREIVLLAGTEGGRLLVKRYFPGAVETGSNRYGATFVGGIWQGR